MYPRSRLAAHSIPSGARRSALFLIGCNGLDKICATPEAPSFAIFIAWCAAASPASVSSLLRVHPAVLVWEAFGDAWNDPSIGTTVGLAPKKLLSRQAAFLRPGFTRGGIELHPPQPGHGAAALIAALLGRHFGLDECYLATSCSPRGPLALIPSSPCSTSAGRSSSVVTGAMVALIIGARRPIAGLNRVVHAYDIFFYLAPGRR